MKVGVHRFILSIAAISIAAVATPAIAADTRLAPVTSNGIGQLAGGIRILEPLAGSAIARGGLRIRITYASSYDGRQLADVTLALASSAHLTAPDGFGRPQDLGIPTQPLVFTWKVSLNDLARGWTPPPDPTVEHWNGSASLSIRTPNAAIGPVAFSLGSSGQRQATTPAMSAMQVPIVNARLASGASSAAPSLKIVEPAEGSSKPPEATRLRVTYPPDLAGKTAEIELSWQEWGKNSWNMPMIVHQGDNVWQVPIAQLGQGIVVPRDKGCNCPSTTQAIVKVRIAGASPQVWNDTVHFAIAGRDSQVPATPAAMSSAPRPMPVAGGAALTSQANRLATPLEIVEPSPGSTATQGNVRVHVRPATNADTAQLADVELSWLPPRPNGAAPPSPPAVRIKTWQASLARLAQGVVLPRDVTDAWSGPTLVRVRIAGAGESAWSAGVSFDLISVTGRQLSTPAVTPNWSAASSAQSAKPAQPTASSALGRVNAVGSATASGAPASALQARP